MYAVKKLSNFCNVYMQKCHLVWSCKSLFSQHHNTCISKWKECDHQGVLKLIEAYENFGHYIGNTNPLSNFEHQSRRELEPHLYGLSKEEKDIENLVSSLQSIYCGSITIETMVVDSLEERKWLHERFREVLSAPLSDTSKMFIWKTLTRSQILDRFLATKFPTLKRYSCEGAESMLVFVEHCLHLLTLAEVQQAVIGMAHRGRNNLLVGSLNFPLETMLRKIKGLSEFPLDNAYATGDVLSHLSVSTDVVIDEDVGKSIHVNLLPNSSFLESVNPVVMGNCWARQNVLGESESRADTCACLLIHGDASFAGQGVVMECFNMSYLPNFNIGGVIHLIVNNQIGFTTLPELGRSSFYASDVGKLIGCPVIHVNGDDPENVLKAATLAVDYQRNYQRDIIIDMVCYRRWGHNEMDDPTITQPLLYNLVENHLPIADAYTNDLTNTSLLSSEKVKEWNDNLVTLFNKAFVLCENYLPSPNYLKSSWSSMKIPNNDKVSVWDTGYSVEELKYIGLKSVEIPDEFDVHKNLKKNHIDARRKKLIEATPIDWALAEALAFGSLLHQGFNIRLSGQDVGRGTFSHRHLAIACQSSGHLHHPLNHLSDDQKAFIEIAPSLLSEEAVLGFEYGVSIENPNRLVVWEAQFGDFFTGAQVPIDTLVISGEAKWMIQSGLVILLPHGYDGAGPEHSSSRIERFLQSSDSHETDVDGDNVNISVCHPTTAAQYFHLLRRQMIRHFRKPLVIASPKILLRNQAAMSPLSNFNSGTHFYPVLEDPYITDLTKVQKVIFCTGKHFYVLHEERLKHPDSTKIAIVRLEELSPFPSFHLQRLMSALDPSTEVVWAQEEPRNMGAWSFVEPRFRNIFGKHVCAMTN